MADLNEEALEAARLAVEDVLIDFRDNGRFMVGANGFTVCDRDGSPSPIMRLTTVFGLQIGIKAYLNALADQDMRPTAS